MKFDLMSSKNHVLSVLTSMLSRSKRSYYIYQWILDIYRYKKIKVKLE